MLTPDDPTTPPGSLRSPALPVRRGGQGTTDLPPAGRALAAGVGVVAGEDAGVDDADVAVHHRAEAFLHGDSELLGLGHGADTFGALGDGHQREVHVGIADALADPLVLHRAAAGDRHALLVGLV